MKRFLRSTSAFLACAFVLISFPIVSSGASPKTSANAYCLMDADTGIVLASDNETKHLPMASTTKIMTCITVIENSDISSVVSVPREAVGVEGSSVYLAENEKLTIEDLLFSLMLESANDAAVALAIAVSGSVSEFAALMNQNAEKLGMTDTHFANPNGLNDKEHYSSASDLAKLMAYCLSNDAFCRITSTKKTYIDSMGGNRRYLSNHNKLLSRYDNCISGKTGFTKNAGRCLVSAARKNGKTLVSVTLNDPDDWEDHVSLFEYGFSQYEYRKLLEPFEARITVPVVGGETTTLVLTNPDGLSVSLPKNGSYKETVESSHFFYAPVYGLDLGIGTGSGNVIYPAARYVVTVNGHEVGAADLYPEQSVMRVNIKNFFERLADKFLSAFR